MKRQIFTELLNWKTKKNRKPLILKGARQVGKTYILKAFGADHYKNVAYINFEITPHFADLFLGSLKPEDILKALSIELSIEIIPGDTLIIFDEIQESPNALNSLKYFNELASEYHVCAAGSLLGVTLANSKGFPVGQVDFLTLYPLTLTEFLLAKGENKLADFLNAINKIEPLPSVIHEKLLRLTKDFLFTGGMPAAVLEYVTSGDFILVRETQKSILNAYRLDFAKHAPRNAIMKINQVWDVIPSQLAKENKKFIYSIIRKGARAQEFEIAIQWLLEAGLIYKTYNTSAPKLPLSAYVNFEIFKIYLSDVGLLGAMADLSPKTIIYGDDIFQEFHGALFENYVAQALIYQDYKTYYWTSSGQAELDFVLQHETKIYPIEVKSGNSSKKKSLSIYIEKYHPELSIRISPQNLKLEGKVLNCPIYLIWSLKKILGE